MTASGRVPRSSEAVRTSYDRLSRWYDWLAHAAEWPLTAHGLRMLGVQPDEAVLEIGCGTGHALAALARASGQAFGLDLSAGMLAMARKRTAAGPAGLVHLVQGEAAHLPYAAASFDAAMMSFTLELFDASEMPRVLAECRRVLRPSGRLGVVALAQADTLAVRLYEGMQRRFPRTIDCRPIQAATILQSAGFQVIARTQGVMCGLPVESLIGKL